VAETPDKEPQADSSNKEKQPDEHPIAPNGALRRLLAIAVSTLAILGAATAFAFSNIDIVPPLLNRLAELFPRQTVSAPMPDPVLAALKDIQTTQQQSALELQRNAVLLRQDAANVEFLRQSSTAQQIDLKKISNQLAMLAARVDSLQNAMGPLTTSSISPANARGQAASRKRAVRLSRPVGPVSIGGAPLSPVPPPGWGA
jgi:hypothetical protein